MSCNSTYSAKIAYRLLAFLQVAAWTNRTAVLPLARVGEPAYAGFPEAGFNRLERYFDIDSLVRRWPCLRTVSFEAYAADRKRAGLKLVDVALQLGLPRGVSPDPETGFVATSCGKRTRPLVAMRAVHACVDTVAAASATATLGGRLFRGAAIMITNWSQKVVGLGDALSPLFGDAFAHRGGCYNASQGQPRDFPPLATQWLQRAQQFTQHTLANRTFICAHLRAEKLASAATGPEKRGQWFKSSDGSWRSPYMENCFQAAAIISTKTLQTRPAADALVLITDTDVSHGTPSNQGSEHFRDWRATGERFARAIFPNPKFYCADFADGDPDCAMVEAAICRQASYVLRFGSGTFSEFIVRPSVPLSD